MIQENCRVADHAKLAANYFKLILSSDHISNNAKPGQFVNVRVVEDVIPLLRRPISIHNTDPANGTFTLLYEVVGRGTELLSKIAPGGEVNILGPLGKGFTIYDTPSVLVAGGMGIAPLGFLAREAIKLKKEVHVLIGARSKELVLCEEGLKIIGANVIVATDDGSYGHKGSVTDLLASVITRYELRVTQIYSCGPKAMLKAVSAIAKQYNLDCEISMEAYMACGIGACKGCAIGTIEGYKMVCKDGPVFDAREIKWE